MRFDSEKHHRRSIRLDTHNYRQAGWYFVTIIVATRQPVLGDIDGNGMRLSDIGTFVQEGWETLPGYFPGLEIDTMVVMPDHTHSLLHFTTDLDNPLGEIIGTFKTMTTRKINAMCHTVGSQFWQRNYYERLVRATELEATRTYIAQNPQRWFEKQGDP